MVRRPRYQMKRYKNLKNLVLKTRDNGEKYWQCTQCSHSYCCGIYKIRTEWIWSDGKTYSKPEFGISNNRPDFHYDENGGPCVNLCIIDECIFCLYKQNPELYQEKFEKALSANGEYERDYKVIDFN